MPPRHHTVFYAILWAGLFGLVCWALLFLSALQPLLITL